MTEEYNGRKVGGLRKLGLVGLVSIVLNGCLMLTTEDLFPDAKANTERDRRLALSREIREREKLEMMKRQYNPQAQITTPVQRAVRTTEIINLDTGKSEIEIIGTEWEKYTDEKRKNSSYPRYGYKIVFKDNGVVINRWIAVPAGEGYNMTGVDW